MRELTIRDTRFCFREALGGQLGEMPSIEIRSDEKIPSLMKARVICVNTLNQTEPTRSTLAVIWIVSGTNIALKLICQADNSRLKEQYLEHPSSLQPILDLLSLPEQPDKKPDQYRRVETETTILKGELPDWLLPLVARVETWQTFFQSPALKHLRGHHYVSISEDGYYMAYISAGCLRLGSKRFPAEDPEGGGEQLEEGFDFNPETDPPTIISNGLYWTLSEPKILVILPHSSSNERVAAYYGYLQTYRRYVEATREHAQAIDAAYCAAEAKDAEKRQRQVATTRLTLLSP